VAKVAPVAAGFVVLAFLGGEVATGSARPRVPARPQVFVVGANGHGLRQITSGPDSYGGVLWLPGSSAVAETAYGPTNEWIESESLRSFRSRQLSAKISSPNVQAILVYSPESKLTVVDSYDENSSKEILERVGGPGSRARVLDSWRTSSGPSSMTAWSPDGRLIAYARPAGRAVMTHGRISTGPAHIATVPARGHRHRFLTHGRGNDGPPVFSSDGRSILFYASIGKRRGFYTVPTRGGPVHRVARGSSVTETVAWSPDGREVALTGYRNRDPRPHLFVVNLRTGRVRTLANSVQLATPAWSPDGKEIAFATWPTVSVSPPKRGYAAVETIHPDGSGARVLVSEGNSETQDLAWSPNGKRIAFTLGPAPKGD
jgi:Tol biopolymer transport system component